MAAWLIDMGYVPPRLAEALAEELYHVTAELIVAEQALSSALSAVTQGSWQRFAHATATSSGIGSVLWACAAMKAAAAAEANVQRLQDVREDLRRAMHRLHDDSD